MAEMFGAIASLAGVLAQAKAQRDANNTNLMNLHEQKRVNRKSEELATSSRTDAYGNKLEYIPGLGWRTQQTPTTKGILDAQQAEQLASLTKDAPRQRADADRKNKRAIAADEEFEKKFSEYKYRPQGSEAADISDAQQLLLSSRRKGIDEASGVLAKQLIRTGSSGQIPALLKQSGDMFADTLSDALLQGKQIGKQQHRADEDGATSALMKELGFLSSVAGDTTTAPLQYSGIGDAIGGQQDDALQALINTIGQGGNRYSAASGQLAQSLGQSPNFSGLASSLSNLGKSMFAGGAGGVTGTASRGPVAPIPAPYEDMIKARTRAANGF